jgi:DNA primase
VVVNYDPDAAGQAATERSLTLLLEKEFDVRVLALPPVNGKPADPDKFLQEQGPEAYKNLLVHAPAYFDYLISKARQMDRSTANGKLAAVNFLMPYLQKMPDRLLRSEWATRIASDLRVDEPVLRESLRRAAAERRSEVKTKVEFIAPVIKPAERRLLQLLSDSDAFRRRLAETIKAESLHKGLESELAFEVLLESAMNDKRPDAAFLAEKLQEKDRRLLFDVLFEASSEESWEEAESCLSALRRCNVELELSSLQRQLETKPSAADLGRLLSRKQELRKRLSQE